MSLPYIKDNKRSSNTSRIYTVLIYRTKCTMYYLTFSDLIFYYTFCKVSQQEEEEEEEEEQQQQQQQQILKLIDRDDHYDYDYYNPHVCKVYGDTVCSPPLYLKI